MISLGIDTSNYTTSAAVLKDGQAKNYKKLLPVKSGEKGLRQSDAVFHHVKQITEVLESAFKDSGRIDIIGVSDRPTDQEGSYMPCFLVGYGTARSISAAMDIPCEVFTHQQGHVAAALYSAERVDLLGKKILAFHVSGGTTEALLVQPDKDKIISCTPIAKSLDLKAGQAIDRVGVMLGLPFPCGPELEILAGECNDTIKYKPSMKGADCSLSGVENKCKALLEKGYDKSYIAKYCITAIANALDEMTTAILSEYGDFPVVFSGGVSSNGAIKNKMQEKFGAFFATPEFSADNGTGVAVLANIKRGIL